MPSLTPSSKHVKHAYVTAAQFATLDTTTTYADYLIVVDEGNGRYALYKGDKRIQSVVALDSGSTTHAPSASAVSSAIAAEHTAMTNASSALNQSIATVDSNASSFTTSYVSSVVASEVAPIASDVVNSVAPAIVTSIVTSYTSSKMDLVSPVTSGHFAALDATGQAYDAGVGAANFASSSHTHVRTDITDLGAVFVIRGTVASSGALPTTGNQAGDVYICNDTSQEYVWVTPEGGTAHWEPFGVTVDVSGKADKVSGATSGDIATLDGTGNLVDGGLALASVSAHLVNTSVHVPAHAASDADKALVVTSDGNLAWDIVAPVWYDYQA